MCKCTRTFALLDIFVCEFYFMDWLAWKIELQVWKGKKSVDWFRRNELWKVTGKVARKSCTKSLHENVGWKKVWKIKKFCREKKSFGKNNVLQEKKKVVKRKKKVL